MHGNFGEDGKIPYRYDVYGFVSGGVIFALIAIPMMFLVTYLISWSLWYFNRKIDKKRNQ